MIFVMFYKYVIYGLNIYKLLKNNASASRFYQLLAILIK